MALALFNSEWAIGVLGNHDEALRSCIRDGSGKQQSGQTAITYNELLQEPPEFQAAVKQFLDNLPTALVLCGKTEEYILTHAGMPVWGHWKHAMANVLPNKTERRNMIHGWKDGSFDASGRMSLDSVYDLPNQMPTSQIFGHCNKSRETTGWTVPYIVEKNGGKYVCVESSIEHAPENILGTFFIQ